jgi:hypothetical protein
VRCVTKRGTDSNRNQRLDENANPCTCQGWQRQRSAALDSSGARPWGHTAGRRPTGATFHSTKQLFPGEGQAWLACEHRWPPDPPPRPCPFACNAVLVLYEPISSFSSFVFFAHLLFFLTIKTRACCGLPGWQLNFSRSARRVIRYLVLASVSREASGDHQPLASTQFTPSRDNYNSASSPV